MAKARLRNLAVKATAAKTASPATPVAAKAPAPAPAAPPQRFDPTQGVAPNDRSEEIAAAAARPKGRRIRVSALRMGYYDHARRRQGDVFDVYESEFSDRWMETVDGSTPTKITTGKQALKAQHDERLLGRVSDRQLGDRPRSSGDANPLGDDD